MTTEQVVQEAKAPRVYKNSPEIRKQIRETVHKFRMKKVKCQCGAQAKYKELATKRKLCLKCLVANEKAKKA
jgi:hypothetical protein